MQLEELSVQELYEKMNNGSRPFILDVREPDELAISSLPATLIPLGELTARYNELEEHKNDEIVCLCRTGNRSAQACFFLRNKGFTNVKNLSGGINQWAREIDPSMSIY